MSCPARAASSSSAPASRWSLKYSEWAKRKYVEFKRRHPNKGRWADWGLRRKSAKRREELRKQQEGARAPADD